VLTLSHTFSRSPELQVLAHQTNSQLLTPSHTFSRSPELQVLAHPCAKKKAPSIGAGQISPQLCFSFYYFN